MHDSSSPSDTLPAAVTALQAMVAERDATILRLKHELLLLRQWRFGRKSEKTGNNGQLSLFPDEQPVEVETEKLSSAKPVRKGHGRKPIPANLPVKRIEIEIPADELVCTPCGSEKIRIGEETRRELDYIPGTVFVREYVRPIYACPRECEGQMVVAPNPSALIEKGLPGPGLLAHVATSKYADHLPLNRMEAILKRSGIDIYEFNPDRKQMHPEGVLANYQGFLQADAYQGYNALFNGDIVEVACWAHARRKFVEAEKSDRRATEILDRIRELYRVEKRSKSICERFGWSFDPLLLSGVLITSNKSLAMPFVNLNRK